MTTATARRFSLTLVAVGVLFVVAAVLGPRADAAPAGNNGTVKVNDLDMDGHGNDPHVSCVFDIKWYGFDEGTQTADVTFTIQSLTHGLLLLTDTFDFQGTGPGDQLDATKSYDLSDPLAALTPQNHQGFHVRLEVDTTGSQGADKKFKVFWVSCAPPQTTTTTSTTTSTTTTVTTAQVLPSSTEQTTEPNTEASVLGEELTREPQLPRTGMDGWLFFVGLALVSLGAACSVGATRLTRAR